MQSIFRAYRKGRIELYPGLDGQIVPRYKPKRPHNNRKTTDGRKLQFILMSYNAITHKAVYKTIRHKGS